MAESTRMEDLYETLKSHEQSFLKTGEIMTKIESGLNELHQTLTSVNQNIEYLLRKTNEAGTRSIAEMGDNKLQEKQKRKETVNYSVGFPDFDGSNPQEWLCQANQFFENYPDDEFAKVRHASFYLTGDADLWFIENFEGKERVTWQHFSSQLLGRFLRIEPIPSGNLSPRFDPSTCRNLFVGNVMQGTEPLLQEVFDSTEPVEICKLRRKEKSSCDFIHYFNHKSDVLAILSLNGRLLFEQPIKDNWAYANSQKEDTSIHYNTCVGDLSSEVTDAMLFTCFSLYPSCSDARVMWGQKTGRSWGFGIVSCRNQHEAQSAINDLTGKCLGSRQIRCNWMTKGAGTSDDKQISDAKEDVLTEFTQLSQNADVVSDSPNIENHVANYSNNLNLVKKDSRSAFSRNFQKLIYSSIGLKLNVSLYYCVATDRSKIDIWSKARFIDISHLMSFKGDKILKGDSVVFHHQSDQQYILNLYDNLLSENDGNDTVQNLTVLDNTYMPFERGKTNINSQTDTIDIDINILYDVLLYGPTERRRIMLYQVHHTSDIQGLFHLTYVAWLGFRAEYIAPFVHSLSTFCVVLFVVQSLDRVALCLGCFYIKVMRIRPTINGLPFQSDDVEGSCNEYPRVLVQIPMCNEREVYEMSISAVCQLDWPMERLLIQVLDDSDDESIQSMIKAEVFKWSQKGINIIYRHRLIRTGYKAGNLKSAMRCDYVKDYEFVAIFDVDFQPTQDFLKQTVPHFKDNPELGLVQARWTFVNKDENLLTRLQNLNLCFHFEVEQQVNGVFLNFFGFNGTAGVWRIKALEESGGWLEWTTVEDMDIAVCAHLNGWKFIYFNDKYYTLSPGLINILPDCKSAELFLNEMRRSNADICVLELLKKQDERNWSKCRNRHPEFTFLSTYIWDPGGEFLCKE